MEKKKYFDELNIFRALIIVWVVIGHSFDAEQSVLGFLHGYAYTFHMNAFFTLSGLLFASKLNKINTVKDKTLAIADRAKRLIVPYLFFTAVSYFLKMFFEKYANNELSGNIIVDVLLGQNNPNGGLWFLYALFLISVLFIILKELNKYITFAISVILRLVIFFVEIDITPIAFIMKYAIFFSAGILIKDFYEDISAYLKSKKATTVIAVILLIISLAVSYINLYIFTNELFAFAVCIFNIITWYFIATAINNTEFIKKAFMTIGDYGMDIYMIGYYVQIVIRVVLGSMLGVPYLIYSMLMCVLVLVLPVLISKYIIRKVGIFRALMLGDFSKKKRD